MGSPPQTTATGIGARRAWYLSRIWRPWLAGRVVEARGLGVMDHHAIGAAVDPALVGIAGDVEAAGAYVVAAVGRVPFGRAARADDDVVSGHDGFETRTVVDVFWRDAHHPSPE